MTGPRYSIIPSRFFEDDRLKPSHFKVMGYLGKHSDRSGWMKLSQTKAAATDNIGIARETVCRAIADLVEWGYVEKRSKKETKRSICFYRILMDAREEPTDDVPDVVGGCDPAVTTGCDVVGHRVVTPEITRVVTHEVTINNDPSSKIKIQRSSARSAPSEVSKSGFGSEVPLAAPPLTVIVITPSEAAWPAWIEFFRSSDQADLAFDANQSKRIRASARWPSADVVVFEPKRRRPPAKDFTLTAEDAA